MKKISEALFQSFDNPGFLKLFPITLILVAGMLSIFIRPGNIDASDFLLIAWEPGQSLLQTGSVPLEYPYPLWTVVSMLPLVIWEPKTAMLLMYICNLVMLAASLTLFLLMFDWKLTPALFALTVSLSVFFLPVLSSLWLGQLTIFSLFVLAMTLFFFLHERWFLLGIVLGLSFIKPQVMLLLAGLLLLWALWQRRWQVLLGFGAVMLGLVLISVPFISNPSQLIGGGISSHLGTYILFTSTIWGVTLSLGMNWLIPLFISMGLMFWLGWLWLPFLQIKEINARQAFFLFSAAVLVNLIVIPYSWMHNLALLLMPLGYCLSLILRINHNSRLGWMAILFVVVYPVMIGLFLTVGMPQDTQAYQIIPALILLPLMIYFEKKVQS